jgi:hypothetical protein
MAQGISKLRRGGGSVRADRLNLWLDGLLTVYADRILPIDAATARLAGEISDAAIAKNADLHLLTCNIKHFEPLGVTCTDPLITRPE